MAICKKNIKAPLCQNAILVSKFAYNLAFYPIRNEQTSVSRRLEAELTELSRHGETTQYIIIGICLALIVVSAGAILPVFLWVIKDKSQVLTIFADITPEEADKIIEGSRTLDIKNIHYKRKWIQSAEEKHEAFWKKLITQHHRGFGRLTPEEAHHEKEKAMAKESTPKPKERTALPPEEKTPLDVSKVEPDEENEDDQQKKQLQEEVKKKAKLETRREKLGEIDHALRRMFVIRLALVLLLFFAYTSFALYFNKYVHDQNSQASTMLFALCKRSIYPHLVNFILYQSLLLNDTKMAGSNLNPQGEMYMMDVADEMLLIEEKCAEFRRTGPALIYQDYFDLVDLSEGDQLCNISDAGSDVDPKLTPCFWMYKGPKDNGLCAGMAYYLDMHIRVAKKFITTNFSLAADVTSLNTANATISSNSVGLTLTFPLSFILGKLVISFYECAMQFFSTVKKIVYGSSAGFVVLFVAIYVAVFVRFIGVLNEEIWHTRGMINMIPVDILSHNEIVREQVWSHRG
ncbi:MAG: hypothetical protein P4M11_11020 [Candidatus Pacebacteria bacterium]|nr:hypothetical protein [Candidatus Paceibacterota bacterium]